MRAHCVEVGDVDYTWYKNNENRAKTIIQNLNKRCKENRALLEKVFGKESWLALTDEERKSHRLISCPICTKSKRYIGPLQLLVGNKKHRTAYATAEKAGLVPKKKSQKEPPVKPKIRKSDEEKIRRQAVKDIENQWKKTSVLRFLLTVIIIMSDILVLAPVQ